jgi:hypothetical protein
MRGAIPPLPNTPSLCGAQLKKHRDNFTSTCFPNTFVMIITSNRNIDPDIQRGDAMATFRLITGHDFLVIHLYRLLLYPYPMCVLCRKENSAMNQGHLLKCTVLNTGNTPSIVKLYWDAGR